MAGFAVLIAPDSTPQAFKEDFQYLLQFTADYKQLILPTARAVGRHCIAAKLDSPAAMIHDPV